MHWLRNATWWSLLLVIHFAGISSGWLTRGARMERGGELSGAWSTLNLGECAVIHFVSLLHDLNDIRLSVQSIWLRPNWDSLCRCSSGSLGQILICYVEIRHLCSSLWVILPSWGTWICSSTLSATTTTLNLSWSLTWSWWYNHLIEILCVLICCGYSWILLARDATLLLLRNLRF